MMTVSASLFPICIFLQTVLCTSWWAARDPPRYLPNFQNALYYNTLNTDVSEDCVTSHVTRYDMVRGRGQPIHFSTSPRTHQDIELPAISPMNATAGEQWEFDGVSEDGTQAFIFGFYRDPNYSFLGTGNLRAYAEFAFSDDSRYAVVDYAEESIIVSCPGPQGGTHGMWRGDGFVYSFTVSGDMSTATITMDSDEANLNITLRSVTPARYPDGSVWKASTDNGLESDEDPSSLTVPYFHWIEPIPAAEATVTGTIEDRSVSWAGVGGHERLWGAFNWRTCLSGLIIVRFRAGPYSLSFWRFDSGRHDGLSFSSLVLFEEGEKLFSSSGNTSQPEVQAETSEDSFTFRKLYSDECNGTTTATLKDKVTGVELILKSPRRNLQWKFAARFKNLGFEYVLTEGRGGTGYSGTVTGGLTSDWGSNWTGPAFVEIMKFPDQWWLLPDNYQD